MNLFGSGTFRRVRWARRIAVAATVAALLWPVVGSAATKCKAKVDPTDGTINVGAKTVVGTLKWGSTSGNATQTFVNGGTCVANGKAKRCQMDTPGSPAAITPPDLCRLYLKDDGSDPECSAYIKGCTPGPRSAAPALVLKDSSDVTIGRLLTEQLVVVDIGTQLLGLAVAGYGFTTGPSIYYTGAGCTGDAFMFEDGPLQMASVIGGTAYYPEGTTQVVNWVSYGDSSGCYSSIPDTYNMVPVATLDVSSYVPPFHAAYEP